MTHLSLTVTGMSCTGCEERVSTVLRRLDGISGVQADHRVGRVLVDYDPTTLEETTIAARLAEAGYELADGAQR